MASGIEVGSFTWPNTTASQTITLNGTFTPVAVIMWTTGPGSSGFTGGNIFSIGYGTRRGGSTQSGCGGVFSADNVSTSDTARVMRNDRILHVLSSTSATDYDITLDSFGAGTIGVTSSSGANVNGDTLQYIAIGGTDITDAIVLNWTMDSTAATEAVTGAGFQPNMIFGIDTDLATANSITAEMRLSFGAAASSTEFTGMSINADDADTMTSGMTWANRILASFLHRFTAAGADDAEWDLDSFDSDGCTLGVVNAPTNTDRVATLLLIKGGTWEVGRTTTDSDTGTDDYTLSNGSLTPTGVFTVNRRSVINFGQGTGNVVDFSLGAFDATRTASAGLTGNEAINTAVDRYWSSSNAIVEIVGNTPTLESNAASPVFSAGAFQVNWSTKVARADNIGYVAMMVNDTPGGGGGRTTKNTRAWPLGMEIGYGWRMEID